MINNKKYPQKFDSITNKCKMLLMSLFNPALKLLGAGIFFIILLNRMSVLMTI